MRSYKLKINDHSYDVTIKDSSAFNIIAEVNGEEYQVTVEEVKNLYSPSIIEEKLANVAPSQTSPQVAAPPFSATDSAKGNDGGILSPIPGQIKKIFVKVGEQVKAGQKVLMLEAMKLENEIACSRAGVVKDILVKEGDSVNQDQLLISIGS